MRYRLPEVSAVFVWSCWRKLLNASEIITSMSIMQTHKFCPNQNACIKWQIPDPADFFEVCILREHLKRPAIMNSIEFVCWGIPLHLAANKFHDNEVMELLKQGADVNEQSKSGYTALHFSVRRESGVGITKLLLEAGAKVNWQNKYGRTPLHEALHHGSLQNVKLLLRHGASLELVDIQNQTPLEWAIHNQRRDMVINAYTASKVMEELLDWGANHSPEWLTSIIWSYHYYIVVKAKIILSRFSLKCKCAKLPYYKEYVNLTKCPTVMKSELCAFQESCMEELERMRRTTVDCHTLHCVFSSCVSVYSNSLMESTISSPDLETDYPIYASLLEATFIKNKKRHQLLNNAEEILFNLFLNNKIFVPNMIVRKILTYFTINELSDFIVNAS